jgi:hypothetical protein
MNHLPVPKLLKWQYSVGQQYSCTQKILVTSGCSFTASSNVINTAASWPGYALDRCRFDHCIDYSYPGAGNEYIGDSILHFFSQVPDNDIDKYMVIIMWSGIDRKEEKVAGAKMPNLNGITYRRKENWPKLPPTNKDERSNRAAESASKILEVYEYLSKRKISFVFTFYANLLFAPYIPKRDTTFEFDDYISPSLLNQLQNLPWVTRKPFEFMYEYAFKNDLLNPIDQFHPNFECTLKWTDEVLLPNMLAQRLIAVL